MILGRGITLIGIGIAIGMVASIGLTRLIASQLQGISATDPLTFGGVILVVLAAGLAACLLPARRAGLVDPMTTLRSE